MNQICKSFDLGLKVFELALEKPTRDITQDAALDEAECAATMAYGMEATEGCDILCIGEMGIGNTTIAAAICTEAPAHRSLVTSEANQAAGSARRSMAVGARMITGLAVTFAVGRGEAVRAANLVAVGAAVGGVPVTERVLHSGLVEALHAELLAAEAPVDAPALGDVPLVAEEVRELAGDALIAGVADAEIGRAHV